jgi:hypothetical protein
LSQVGQKTVGRCYDFLNIFVENFLAKNRHFLLETKVNYAKIRYVITLVFEKNANFFAENWQKSQKIVIMTTTPCLCKPPLTFVNSLVHMERRGAGKKLVADLALHFDGACNASVDTI